MSVGDRSSDKSNPPSGGEIVIFETEENLTSAGDIKETNDSHRRWLERLSNMSAVMILLVATVTCGLLAWHGNETISSNAIQILGVIVGAAASALWQQTRS